METYYVFVYGTLKKGKWNHRSYLGDSKFVCVAKTAPKYCLFQPSPGSFPYCADVSIDAPELATRVVGEIWQVNADTLRRLDQLEGYPSHYSRSLVDVHESVGANISNGVTVDEAVDIALRGVMFYHVPYAQVKNMKYRGACWPIS